MALWPFILGEYWPPLLFYVDPFIATLAFGYATLARVLGLAHLGQKVDLIEPVDSSVSRRPTNNAVRQALEVRVVCGRRTEILT